MYYVSVVNIYIYINIYIYTYEAGIHKRLCIFVVCSVGDQQSSCRCRLPHGCCYKHWVIYVCIIYICTSIYPSSRDWVHSGNHGLPHGWSRALLDRLQGSGDEMMYPEAYMERLASTEQVSDVKNVIRGPFSSISLTSLGVSVYFVWCMISCPFPCFRGYGKDAERYLESICPRDLAEALFWTCLVKETLFSRYWQVFARRHVEIEIEAFNSCSPQAARIQRSDFDDLCICIHAS